MSRLPFATFERELFHHALAFALFGKDVSWTSKHLLILTTIFSLPLYFLFPKYHSFHSQAFVHAFKQYTKKILKNSLNLKKKPKVMKQGKDIQRTNGQEGGHVGDEEGRAVGGARD